MPSILSVVLVSALLAPIRAQEAHAQGTETTRAEATARPRVLLVSGANNHDWTWTGPSLKRMLEESGRFDVVVTTKPSVVLADALEVAKYDAFVLDYNGPRWGDAAEEVFLEAVRAGAGVAVIHAADNAFPGWEDYERLVGHLWRDGTSHGSFHEFDVTIDDRDHPVTRGLPDLVAHPDELYHALWSPEGIEHRVLATAYSDPETGGSGEREPMIVVAEFGNGRMFHTPLGHVWKGHEESRRSHLDPQFQRLVLRGVEWAATGDVNEAPVVANDLTEYERRAGWRLLFDGKSTDGWRGFDGEAFPSEGWSVANGALHHGKGGGDIVTREAFGDFELAFQWRVATGANSGVKYRFPIGDGIRSPVGPEFQILDDAAHRDAIRPKTAAASLYDVAPALGKVLAPAGAWNHSRIVSVGDRIEHWLNGKRVLALDVGSEAWLAAVGGSKFKGNERYGRVVPSPIALQDHGDEVWFRDLRLRDPSNPPGERIELFDGETLDGWRVLGGATYTVEDGEIVGRTPEGGLARNSFLTYDRPFSDFVLELDLMPVLPGNSGVQVRSTIHPDGYLVGYQIEVDPSERAWSGGLYDEMRAGWLQDLSNNPEGRAAFRMGEWNHYRIECVGPTIKAWVNGVPTADFAHHADASGYIGLQVHNGDNGHLRWRNVVLWDLAQ